MWWLLPYFGYIILSIVLIILFNELVWIRISKTVKQVNEFPGPKTYPILGNLRDILTEPETIFKRLRKFGLEYYPVYRLWSSNFYYAINVVSPDDMQLVMSNMKHNEKSDIYMLFDEWLGEGLLTSGGEKWQHRRKILTPTFHFNILKQFISVFNKHADKMIKEVNNDSDKTVDVLPFIHRCSLRTITEAAMGTVFEDDETELTYRKAIYKEGEIMIYRILRPWLYFRITNLFTKQFFVERFNLKYLKKFTRSVIEKREADFNEDIINQNIDLDDVGMKKKRLAMLDLLISAKRRNEIDNDGVVEEVDTFTFEGHDTISMAMAFVCMLLACNKFAQDMVYEELQTIFGNSKRSPTYDDLQNMNYMELVIKETLRLYPSVPLVSRFAGEEIVTSGGHVIPKGSRIILHIYDTHHNPKIYPDPEKFDPERFLPENAKNRHPYAYLPFSAGSRNCIGQKYAMLNMKSMVAYLIRNYEIIPVDTPETIVLAVDIILRAKNGIKMKFKPRAKAL